MNCPFKFVVFLRSSVWRINGVCRALMMACSRTDANVRCNLLLLITLFFNSPHSSFLSLSLSQSLCIFFSLCYSTVSLQAALFSLCCPVYGCLIALPLFYLQIYAFKLMLIIGVHSGISSCGLLFALVCRNLSLFKVTVMVVLCIFNRISEMMDHCTLPR